MTENRPHWMVLADIRTDDALETKLREMVHRVEAEGGASELMTAIVIALGEARDTLKKRRLQPASPSPVSAPSGVSLAPDLARDPFGIGLLLDSMGKDREFAESCLLAVIRVCQKHFGDDAVRVSSGQLAAFLDEMLSKASPAPSPVSAWQPNREEK